MVLFIAPMVILLAGTGDALYGNCEFCVPADVNTYEVYERNTLVGCGGVRYKGEGDWLKDSTPRIEKLRAHGSQVEVVYDRPWDPRAPETITLTARYHFKLERRTARKARVEKGWRDAGFVLEGGTYILQTELEKLRYALEKANQPTEDPPPPILKGSDVIESPPVPGLTRQFWLHGLILVGGLAVLGVLTKTFFLR